MYVNSVRQWLSAATKHTECASQAYELNDLSMVKKIQANSIVLRWFAYLKGKEIEYSKCDCL